MRALSAPRVESPRLGGKYVLLARIARGGMGEIWLARNDSTRAQVAIKVLHAGDALLTDVAARFRHEAYVASLLTHRNIVQIFDLLEEPDGTLALVMEMLRGESLSAYLKKKQVLETAEALALMIPIISALGHAHDHGIVHRDIKPANIMLSQEPDGLIEPKLLDFGIAKTGDNDTHTKDGQVLGTPKYMSPEQIRAAPLDGRSDLFSATIVLYELLTGKNPFSATTPAASLASVIETEIDPDPTIDPRLWLVLKRGFAKQPYERFANASEYIAALRSAIPGLEEQMAAALKREPPKSGMPGDSAQNSLPPPIEELGADAPLEDGGKTELDASQAQPALLLRPRRQAVVLVVAATFLLLAGLGVRALTSSGSSSSTGSTEGLAAIDPSKVPEPTPSGSSAEISLDDPAEKSATDEPHRAKAVRSPRVTPRPAASKKKIATTPGF